MSRTFRVLFRATMFAVAFVLGCIGIIAVPAYAVFMVVWLHAPAASVCASTLPVVVVMLVLSWGAAKIARPTRRSSGSPSASTEHNR